MENHTQSNRNRWCGDTSGETMERTLLIIKPEAVREHHLGEIISIIEDRGLTIVNIKMELFTRKRAEGFYEVHRGQTFFEPLIDFMLTGPVVQLILEHENCVQYVRDIVGITDPEKAAAGTIRKKFGKTVRINAVHASDSVENAAWEIDYIFNQT